MIKIYSDMYISCSFLSLYPFVQKHPVHISFPLSNLHDYVAFECKILLQSVKKCRCSFSNNTCDAEYTELFRASNEMNICSMFYTDTGHFESFCQGFLDAGEVVRKISIPSDLSDLLRRFVTLYRKQAKSKDHLLQSERGNQFSYLSLYKKVPRIGVGSGIDKLTPAILRHTYIKRLYDVEQDLRYVMKQAGYANCRTISKYVKIDQMVQDSKTKKTCDACGATTKKGKGKRIESGQILCNDCLSYFQSGLDAR